MNVTSFGSVCVMAIHSDTGIPGLMNASLRSIPLVAEGSVEQNPSAMRVKASMFHPLLAIHSASLTLPNLSEGALFCTSQDADNTRLSLWSVQHMTLRGISSPIPYSLTACSFAFIADIIEMASLSRRCGYLASPIALTYTTTSATRESSRLICQVWQQRKPHQRKQ